MNKHPATPSGSPSPAFSASDRARQRILGRLRQAPAVEAPALPDWAPPAWPPAERLDRLVTMLEGFHAEVWRVPAADWVTCLRQILMDKGVHDVLFSPSAPPGVLLAEGWNDGQPSPALVPYDQPVEQLKDLLVHGVDAAITSTLAGIAETGSLVLWPTPAEPRLMSLLPPLHIAIVHASRVVDSLAVLMDQQAWASRMPTNVVLVSGPSKTADIEQTLAYGVHGPKELLVLLVEDLEDSGRTGTEPSAC